ncbi:lysine-specific demethylase 5B [Protopterus annectens]|uniref:lysine-specific demethylase 5B n=1 Tax=Protopterus annectens TaxID=7888 RepID=UPI001CF9A272|nr:lysine-specific demethylase 5B [Protopterus annectens]
MASEFVPPPECPVFEPSWEEFADPYAFINKIRPIVEKTGICKVRPPSVSRLVILRSGGIVDVQSHGMVWLQEGSKDKWYASSSSVAVFQYADVLTLIPLADSLLELLIVTLQHAGLVAEEGGFDIVCKERRWTKIAAKMGFSPGKAIGSHIRSHYERVLYPFNLFQSGASLLCVQKPTLMNDDAKDKEYKPHDIAQRQSLKPSENGTQARRAKRMRSETAVIKTEPGEPTEFKPHNLRRRMGCATIKCESVPEKNAVSLKQEPLEKKEHYFIQEKPKSRNRKSTSVVDLYVCLVCGSGSDEDRLLLCDGCDDSYHTFCLIPPLQDVPKGDWRCPKCLAQECRKPGDAFGFEQASRDYTLREFGEMADAFKSDYFNMPVHMVPTELVEKEFWRLLSTVEEDVTVEYGADIASKEFGSGFPVKDGKIRFSPDYKEYIESGWNLNNMPVLAPSVLAHVTADICGMKLPWLYVGMCFSSFCWHIEDHWSYSINYLHWGEPKTWYGAPGSAAEQLEDVMKKVVPELFESQPDLLHQLVTIMNPNTLMAQGVPIYRTNQCAGEFVITFPRAYHSGFNQGFNFAEAVNFCTVDWLPLGRQCVEHYRLLNRLCVFSHDEMICKMACKADSLDVVLASAVQKEMAIMIDEEKALRERVRKLGVIESRREVFELLADDERQCLKCKTTCFTSAVSCPCSPKALVCLYHVDYICSCPSYKYILRYQYTLDDLYPMMNALKLRAESYNEWAATVTESLEAKVNSKKSLSDFKALLEESEKKKFPDNDLLRHLRLVTQDAEKCASVAQQLLNGKRQTRFRYCGGKSQNQLTVDELRCFVRQLYTLPCFISQAPPLKDLLARVDDFQQQTERALSEEVPNAAELQKLLDISLEFDVELPQLSLLRERLEQARWLEEVQHANSDASTLSLDDMRRLIDLGVGLGPHAAVEKAMARLQELLTISEYWEDKAKSLMKARPHLSLAAVAEAVSEIEDIPAYLPSGLALKDAMQRAQDWLQEVECLQAGGRVPVLDMLIELVAKGHAIPVHLDPLPRLESLVAEVQTWKESAAKTFLTKNSSFTLLEVLCPRFDVGVAGVKKKQKKLKETQCVKRVPRVENLIDLEKALSESKDTSAATFQVMQSNSTVGLTSLNGGDNKATFLQPALSTRPYCHPLDSLGTELEELLMEAQLLQVSLPEVQELYQLLLSGQRLTIQQNEHSSSMGATCEKVVARLQNTQDRNAHRTENACFTVKKDMYVVDKKQKRCYEKDDVLGEKKENKNFSTSKRKKFKFNQEHSKDISGRKLKKEREKRLSESLSVLSDGSYSEFEDSEDEDAVCPAEGCLQPEGDEVDWVQCDGSCNQWFHQICVGVSSEMAEKEDYICSSCKVKGILSRK